MERESLLERESDRTIGKMQSDVENLKRGQEEIKTILERFIESSDKKYVSKEAFSTVRNIVYGGVATILSSVLIALLAMVIRK